MYEPANLQTKSCFGYNIFFFSFFKNGLQDANLHEKLQWKVSWKKKRNKKKSYKTNLLERERQALSE